MLQRSTDLRDISAGEVRVSSNKMPAEVCRNRKKVGTVVRTGFSFAAKPQDRQKKNCQR